MKIFIFLFSVLSFGFSMEKGFSQDTKIVFDSHIELSVEEVFEVIKKQTDVTFIYKSNLFSDTPKIFVDQGVITLKNLLMKCKSIADFDFQISKKGTIYLKGNPKKIEPKVLQLSISGVVTDVNGVPLGGTNVLEKGTTNGVTADFDGNFSIKVTDDNAVLVVSYIGFATKEVPVTGQTNLNIVLEESAAGLDEVVLVGYGTMRKSDLTGATVHIDMTEAESRPSTNISQLLSGYYPGLNATSNGLAGSSGYITIRGATTLSASQSPLIVLDGIIYNGSLSNINTNDIESIEVLKDASAAAIYGARSANGVLLINTKRGKNEKPTFELNTYLGFQHITNTKRIDVMNAEQYAISRVDHSYQQTLRTWYNTNPTDGTGRPVRPDVTNREVVASFLRSQEEKDNYLVGKESDWINEGLKSSPIQNYDISVSGRSERTNYYLSASYTDQQGILKNDNFKRQSILAKFENKISDWFTLGLNTSYSFGDKSGVGANLNNMVLSSPLGNFYDDIGNYTQAVAEDLYVTNPFQYTVVDNNDTETNLNIALFARFEVPAIKGLNYEFNYSRNLFFYENDTFYPSTTYEGSFENGKGLKSSNENQDWLLNNILTYKKTFNEFHRLNATLVYTRGKRTGKGSFLQSTDFSNDILGYNALEVGVNQNVNSSAWSESNTGLMGRLNYTYKDRYMLTATMRRDGYSGFGENSKYANFPSFGLGWTISEEGFANNSNWLNLLKLRLSYGINGNQGIGAYASQARMGTTNYVYGDTSTFGLYPSTLGNSGLRWETTTSINAGLDFAILGQRILGSIDAYKSKSSDVLVQRTVPQTTGYSTIWDNVSELENKGIELTISTVNIKNSSFNWNSRFSFSMNRNEIVDLYEGVTEDKGNRWFVGEPIHAHYDLKVGGVWQEEALFNGTLIAPYLPGDMKLVDLNTDGVINDDDRSIIGYPDPNYRFGIYNDFSYKNFTLGVFINSIQGGNGYYMDDPGEFASRPGGADRALRTNRIGHVTYWTPETPVNDQPAMFYPYEGLFGMYFSRSFVRLQDVSLSYTLEDKVTNKIGLNNLQIYVSGNNLYTWTKWPGYDPELAENGTPMMRTFLMGVKVSF